MLDRRDFVKSVGITMVATAIPTDLYRSIGLTQNTSGAKMPFSLPPLSYDYDALEPYIDTQTMHIHHDKHHAAYVKNLNAAIANYPDLGMLSVENLVQQLDKVPESVRTIVRNNGGGHANHSFFWQIMQKNAPAGPKAELARAIDAKFGNLAAFQELFTKAALSVFGSGWAWLSLDSKHELGIETTPNQDSPWMSGRAPILGIDVWEHAYYLKYQNLRADYIAAFLKVISWDFAADNFQRARKI